MDLFNKATKVAKSVGDTIYSSTKEQSELAGLNVQAAVVEKKLNSYYAEIGKRYVEYISNCENEEAFNVDDIMENISPELDKLVDIKVSVEQKKEQIRQNNLERDKKKAKEEFDNIKRKLDKAIEMDIISADEYDEKLAAAQRKFENFDLLRKLEQQYKMDIITKEELDEKVKVILGEI